MSNPFAAPTSNPMDALLPMMLMSSMQSAPQQAAPAKAPQQSPGTFKPQTSSFAGAPTAPPTQQQLGGKTLLGQ